MNVNKKDIFCIKLFQYILYPMHLTATSGKRKKKISILTNTSRMSRKFGVRTTNGCLLKLWKIPTFFLTAI